MPLVDSQLLERQPDLETVRAILREHETELRGLGIAGLSLFGSVARRTAQPDSDIDIAVRLDADKRRRGLAYVGQLTELEHRLSAILGRHVDVIEEPADNRRLQSAIERDRVVAYS